MSSNVPLFDLSSSRLSLYPSVQDFKDPLTTQLTKCIKEVLEARHLSGKLPAKNKLLSIQQISPKSAPHFAQCYKNALAALNQTALPLTDKKYLIFSKQLPKIEKLLTSDPDEFSSYSEQGIVVRFNEFAQDQNKIRASVLQRIENLRNEVFIKADKINDRAIGSLRLSLLQLYHCKDPLIKDKVLRTLIEILEGDPLSKYSSYLLVSLQKCLIGKIHDGSPEQQEGVTDLYPDLQHLLVKAYALTLEAILLQMSSPDPNIGRIQQSTKEEIWKGVDDLKSFLEGSSTEIQFWLHYSHQAVQRIKTDESDLMIALGRVWNIVKVGFNIARAIQNPEDADEELEGAYQNLKNAFAFFGLKKDWFEDLLFIRKLSRCCLGRPELFSQLMDLIQTKMLQVKKPSLLDAIALPGDPGMDNDTKLTLGIVIDLESVLFAIDHPQIQESALKLLLQLMTSEKEEIQQRIFVVLRRMSSAKNTALKNTAIILLRFYLALGLVEAHQLPATVFQKKNLQRLLSNTLFKSAYFPHVIHFFLKRIAEIKGIGNQRADSIAKLLAASKDMDVVKAIISCIAEIAPGLIGPDFEGKNLYYMSVELGNVNLVNFLGQSAVKLDIDAKERINGNTPLHLAVSLSHPEMVRALLNGGASVDQANDAGETPLHLAVRSKHYSASQYQILNDLVQNKAQLDARDIKGFTPLNLVIQEGNAFVVDFLLRQGAKVREEIFGSSALEVACIQAKSGNRMHELIVQYIIEDKLRNNSAFTTLEGVYLTAVLSEDGATICCSQDFAKFHSEKMLQSRKYRKGFSFHQNRMQLREEKGVLKLNRSMEAVVVPDEISKGLTSKTLELTELIKSGDFKIDELFHQILNPQKRKKEVLNSQLTKQLIFGSSPLGIRALHIAAVTGNVDAVSFLAASGADVDAQDQIGMTPLHFAALYRQNGILRKLLELGAKPNITNQFGDTPFMMYCGHIPSRSINTHLSVINVKDLPPSDDPDESLLRGFIEKGANPDLLDKEKNNSLHHAVEAGNLICIQWLIKNFPQLALQKNFSSLLPLDLAVINQDESAINAHLQPLNPKELAVFSTDYNRLKGQSLPLAHILADSGNFPLLEQLFMGDASQALQPDGSCRKEIPLHRAAIKGHLPIVQLYEKLEIDRQLKDGFGNTIAHLAALFHHQKLLKHLDETSFDFSIRNHANRLAAHIAARSGNVSLIKLCGLRKFILSKDGHGDLPIHLAARYGHLETVEYMASHFSAIMWMGDDEGNTPAHIAAGQGHEDVVKYFIDKGFDPETPNFFSESLLHMAAQEGKTKVLKRLLAQKVDIRAQDFEGETALHKAAFHQDKETMALLLETAKGLAGLPLILIHDIRKEISLLEILKKRPASKMEEERQKKALELLLRFEAPVLYPNEYGQNFLHLTCLGGNVGLLRFLETVFANKKDRLDFNAVDHKGNNCLHYAVESGSEDVVELLINAKCSLNHRNAEGSTPLAKAVSLRKFSLCKLLYEHKAIVTIVNNHKENLIHRFFSLPYPIASEGVDFIKSVIMKYPELLTGKDEMKQTPLHILAQFGHEDCLEIVLRGFPNSLNIKEMSNYLWNGLPGKTPLKIAEEQKHKVSKEEGRHYEKLIQKINYYKLEDLGRKK